MIRVAAVGDVHYDRSSRGRMRVYIDGLRERADCLLLAGDLTQCGAPEEAQALADDLRGAPVPVIAVLGNHDYHLDRQEEVASILTEVGVTVLEGTTTTLTIGGKTAGIIGLKGFGGGFGGACITEFGEPETKAFAHHAKKQADILRQGLLSLQTDFKFVLTHYSPVDATLLGEKREIFPFLGSYLLAQAIDEAGADAVFHGHAHYGTERGFTASGIPVRNVAQMVIRHAYNIYTFEQPVSRLMKQEAELAAARV